MSTVLFRHLFLIAFVLWSSVVSQAADSPRSPVVTVEWNQLKDEGRLKTGEIVRGQNDQHDHLKLVHEKSGNHLITLWEMDAPPITTPSYALRGTIRYDNVVGSGFLELLNHFSDGVYFTRTMDTMGPMQSVTGTSPEREFILPFHTLGQVPAPKKLVLNLVLNGPGTVEIGPLELIAIDTPAAMSGSGWWSDSTGGLIGGIGGTILGLLGGLIGTLAGVGKGKKLVLVVSTTMAGLGAMVLITGIYGVATGQPYAVFYPLLLLGGMMTLTGLVTLFVVPSRFRDIELRRMQALDAT